MKIRITFDLDEEDRRAIALSRGHWGRPASRVESENYINATVQAALEGLIFQRQQAMEQAVDRFERGQG